MPLKNKKRVKKREEQSGTDLETWRLGAKVFLGASSHQTKGCDWLID